MGKVLFSIVACTLFAQSSFCQIGIYTNGFTNDLGDINVLPTNDATNTWNRVSGTATFRNYLRSNTVCTSPNCTNKNDYYFSTSTSYSLYAGHTYRVRFSALASVANSRRIVFATSTNGTRASANPPIFTTAAISQSTTAYTVYETTWTQATTEDTRFVFWGERLNSIQNSEIRFDNLQIDVIGFPSTPLTVDLTCQSQTLNLLSGNPVPTFDVTVDVTNFPASNPYKSISSVEIVGAGLTSTLISQNATQRVFRLTPSPAVPGAYTVSAKVTDNMGGVYTSPISCTYTYVQKYKPAVSLWNPYMEDIQEAEIAPGNFNFTGGCWDDGTVTSITLTLQNQAFDPPTVLTINNPTCTYGLSNISWNKDWYATPGVYNLSLSVTDNEGFTSAFENAAIITVTGECYLNRGLIDNSVLCPYNYIIHSVSSNPVVEGAGFRMQKFNSNNSTWEFVNATPSPTLALLGNNHYEVMVGEYVNSPTADKCTTNVAGTYRAIVTYPNGQTCTTFNTQSYTVGPMDAPDLGLNPVNQEREIRRLCINTNATLISPPNEWDRDFDDDDRYDQVFTFSVNGLDGSCSNRLIKVSGTTSDPQNWSVETTLQYENGSGWQTVTFDKTTSQNVDSYNITNLTQFANNPTGNFRIILNHREQPLPLQFFNVIVKVKTKIGSGCREAVSDMDASSEIKNNAEQPFAIYPNPTKGSITIKTELGASGFATVNIFDALGKNVISEKVYKNKTKVNLNKLSNGIYHLKVSGDSGVKTQKLIVANN